MFREERFQLILQLLKKEGKADYELLAQTLDVSADTIRRDLELLSRNGLISKVRGGAILRANNPLTFRQRKGYLAKGKDVIALKAQQFIRSGDTIFMDGGTTNCAIAASFAVNLKCRIITNNMALVAGLRHNSNIEILLLGGIYNPDTETTGGADAARDAAGYVADLYLMGTCAIDSRFGITATYREEVAVKKAMLGTAHKTIALSNHEKLGSSDHFRICDYQEVFAMITDVAADHASLDAYRGLGPALI